MVFLKMVTSSNNKMAGTPDGRRLLALVVVFIWGCSASVQIKKEKSDDPADVPIPSSKKDDVHFEKEDQKGEAKKKECNGDETYTDLSITLSVRDNLELVCTANDNTKEKMSLLTGVLDVSITNHSCRDTVLAHMDPANLKFQKSGVEKSFSLFHPCDPGFLFTPWDRNRARDLDSGMARYEGNLSVGDGEVVFLKSGETQTFRIESWGCDGGPYEPILETGVYSITYQMHEIEPFRTFPEMNAVAGPLKDQIEEYRNRLNSDDFWKNSHRSNAIEVNIEEVKCKQVKSAGSEGISAPPL